MSIDEAGLRQQAVALLQDDVVHEAEIFRRDEARASMRPASSLFTVAISIGDRREFAAVIFGVVTFQRPFTVRQTSSKSCSGGQAFAGHRQRRAHRTVLRRDAAAVRHSRRTAPPSRPRDRARRRAGPRAADGSRRERAGRPARRQDRQPAAASAEHHDLQSLAAYGFLISSSPATTVSCDGARLNGSQVCGVAVDRRSRRPCRRTSRSDSSPG